MISCPQCGRPVPVGAHYCSTCGMAIPVAPPVSSYGTGPGQVYCLGFPKAPVSPAEAKAAAQRLRLRQHLQPLGITWILWGVYRLLMGAIAGTAVRMLAHRHGWWAEDNGDLAPFFGAFVWPAILVGTLVTSGLSILAGIGLLSRRPWARVLGIVMGILALLKIPLGTALGIYTLWVLAPTAAGLEYSAAAAQAAGSRPDAAS